MSARGLMLGVDPGRIGGAVLRDSAGRVVGWWVWRSLAAGVRLVSEKEELRGLFLLEVGEIVGARALALGCSALVVEGLFSGSAGAQPLIEGCGALMAGLARAGIAKPIARPLAVERRRGHIGWRQAVLGLPKNLSAERAEAEAVRWAMGERGGACWLPRGLSRAEQGAVAEAWAIAGFGFLVPEEV